MPKIEYKAHIMAYGAQRAESNGRYRGAESIGEPWRALNDDERFDHEAYNAALLELETEGKVVYFRKEWWLPEQKKLYQQQHAPAKRNTTTARKRTGLL